MKRSNKSYKHPYPYYGYNIQKVLEFHDAGAISTLHLNNTQPTLREDIFWARYSNIKNSKGNSLLTYIINDKDRWFYIKQWVNSTKSMRKHNKDAQKAKHCYNICMQIAFNYLKINDYD